MQNKQEIMVPVTRLAWLLECTERSIQQLAKDGTLPKSQRGKYPLFPCVQAYVRHQRRLIEGSGDLTLVDERKRLTKAQADDAEFKLQIAKENYISKNAMADILGRIFKAFRDRLLAIPTKLAPQIIGRKQLSEIKEILDDAIHECLNELITGFRSRGVISGNGNGGGGNTAAKADCKPVGRRKKVSKP